MQFLDLYRIINNGNCITLDFHTQNLVLTEGS